MKPSKKEVNELSAKEHAELLVITQWIVGDIRYTKDSQWRIVLNTLLLYGGVLGTFGLLGVDDYILRGVMGVIVGLAWLVGSFYVWVLDRALGDFRKILRQKILVDKFTYIGGYVFGVDKLKSNLDIKKHKGRMLYPFWGVLFLGGVITAVAVLRASPCT